MIRPAGLSVDRPTRLRAALLAAGLGVFGSYVLFGHSIIRLAYDGRAPLLRSLIRYQHLAPVEDYLAKADDFVWRLAVFVLGAAVVHVLARRLPYYFRPHALLAFLAATALVFMKPSGHDWQFHVFRLSEAALAFWSGDFPLYVSPNIANGKGLPVFVFYSSWLCVPSILLSLTGLGYFASLKVVVFALGVIAGAGMYRCLTRWITPPGAALGSLLFVTSGYFLGDVFVRFAFAEIHAYALLPWACFFLMRSTESGALKDHVAFAVVIALMVVTHPFTMLNASFGLAAVGIATAAVRYGRRPRSWGAFLGKIAVAGGAALLLSAFYWIPLAFESRYALQNRALPVHYTETFLSIGSYLRVFDYTSLGLPLSVAILAAVCAGWRRRRREEPRRRQLLAMAPGMVFLVYLWLTFRASDVVWESVTWLQKAVFVWRMLLPMTVFGSLFVALRLLSRDGISERLFRWISASLILNALVFVVVNAGRPILTKESPDDVPSVLGPYVKEQGWGVGEFLPNPATIPVLARASILGTLETVSTEQRSVLTRYTIKPVLEAGYYRLERFWHVRYRLFADGSERPLHASPSGKIVAWLEGRETQLSLATVKPGYVRYSEMGSAIGWMGVAIGFFAWSVARLRSRMIPAAHWR